MINIIDKLKEFFEPDKCIYCGENDNTMHQWRCFKEVLGYNECEEFEPSSRIYFMKLQGLI